MHPRLSVRPRPVAAVAEWYRLNKENQLDLSRLSRGGLKVWADITLDGRTFHFFERCTVTAVSYRDEGP
ncbi:hypothetical protein TNCV_637801 [Trichonephila clavipes]|nr:hypothetical protein TNCV_637801 [Trichonephila clavipes]